ncbi:unnamed protein product [marine sediment metagenome]|uniref:Uncharacterized protein n=1 Tax=marine sediment metagenome TaxID=412755 RepID=X1IQP2_9ZZZZ
MKYYNILKLLRGIDLYFQGQTSLFDLALLLDTNFNTLRTALLRMELIDVNGKPHPGLTADVFTHAILFYFLLLASGKRKKE